MARIRFISYRTAVFHYKMFACVHLCVSVYVSCNVYHVLRVGSRNGRTTSSNGTHPSMEASRSCTCPLNTYGCQTLSFITSEFYSELILYKNLVRSAHGFSMLSIFLRANDFLIKFPCLRMPGRYFSTSEFTISIYCRFRNGIESVFIILTNMSNVMKINNSNFSWNYL